MKRNNYWALAIIGLCFSLVVSAAEKTHEMSAIHDYVNIKLTIGDQSESYNIPLKNGVVSHISHWNEQEFYSGLITSDAQITTLEKDTVKSGFSFSIRPIAMRHSYWFDLDYREAPTWNTYNVEGVELKAPSQRKISGENITIIDTPSSTLYQWVTTDGKQATLVASIHSNQ
ncbi:hypothetical protein ACPV5E_22000 [Vibrio mediterranei]|uniref:hypothetical protein n=2 Tax=Vibrio TaxID=662 RepID=UPI004068C364